MSLAVPNLLRRLSWAEQVAERVNNDPVLAHRRELARARDFTVAAALAPVIRPLPPSPGEVIPGNYEALCDRLGYKPAGLADAKFRQFCFDEEIPIYDNAQVNKYLQKKGGRGTIVTWWPLRAQDGSELMQFTSHLTFFVRHTQDRRVRPYSKVIPERVLLIADQIVSRFPEAKLYVSEIERDPDPFLGVTFDGDTLFVVAVWDEPGFSG